MRRPCNPLLTVSGRRHYYTRKTQMMACLEFDFSGGGLSGNRGGAVVRGVS
jgi:hypothetical protein